MCLVWSGAVDSLVWSGAVNSLVWSGAVNSLVWSGAVNSLVWSAAVNSLVWSGAVDSLIWSGAVDSLIWSGAIDSLVWSGIYALQCQWTVSVEVNGEENYPSEEEGEEQLEGGCGVEEQAWNVISLCVWCVWCGCRKEHVGSMTGDLMPLVASPVQSTTRSKCSSGKP